jgi:hypothetical protein
MGSSSCDEVTAALRDRVGNSWFIPVAVELVVVLVLANGTTLATLMSLLDHCVEYLSEMPDQPVTVPVTALAERVLSL